MDKPNRPRPAAILIGMANRLAKGDLTAAEQHHMAVRLRHLAKRLREVSA